MREKTDWTRFLLASLGAAILVFVLDVAWHGTIAHDMYRDYPNRPADQVQSLLPFLFLTYLTQLSAFCYLYLRIYRERNLSTALWWGLWGGFFVVIPNMQFFVGIPHMGWGLLGMQVVEGIALMVLLMAVFHAAYRPRSVGTVVGPEPEPVAWPRFLVLCVVGAVTISIIDLAFHGTVAPKLFPGIYPPADFPQRAPEETMPLLPFLLATYPVQLTMFCYMYLRLYPQRGMNNALWWGVWGAVFVFIPNLQIFVSLDHYTWTMLGIQLVEGIILPVMMTVYFELVFRPKPGGARLAAA